MEADFYSGKAVPSSGGGTTINNKDVTVTPETTEQTLTVPEGYTGYGTISVDAVTSSIDSDITASNIKSGVTILGVTGDVVESNETSLSITPSTSQQNITPTSPYTGYNAITVGAVTSSIDNNIQADNIKSGVTILGVTGTYTAGGSGTRLSLNYNTASKNTRFVPDTPITGTVGSTYDMSLNDNKIDTDYNTASTTLTYNGDF